MRGNQNRFQTSFQQPLSFKAGAEKKSLRAFYRRKSALLSPSLKKEKEKKIVYFLNKLPFWKKASSIAVYKALKNEPCLLAFCNLRKGKVCFPAVEGDSLSFYKSDGSWRASRLKALEPPAQPKNKVSLKSISVFLVPGQAFDRNGGRLGRGKGYYDKTLASAYKTGAPSSASWNFDKWGRAPFIGIAFSDQVHNEPLPLLPHDILMDFLVTDRFILMPLNKRIRKNTK